MKLYLKSRGCLVTATFRTIIILFLIFSNSFSQVRPIRTFNVEDSSLKGPLVLISPKSDLLAVFAMWQNKISFKVIEIATGATIKDISLFLRPSDAKFIGDSTLVIVNGYYTRILKTGKNDVENKLSITGN